ncbi:MAG: tetratricopeptide repeat protein [Deltaproteobacteria bacterium]|nr:tetratricopeptide repeat protein [Deltaproteobacteria bacterium]
MQLRHCLLSAAFAIGLGVTALAPQAQAQSYNQAVDAFEAGNFADAATLFYATIRFDDEDEGVITEAQFGLAKSFFELKLYAAALKYFEDIVKIGADHPRFKDAVEGLIAIADILGDDLKIPPVIDAIYTANQDYLTKISVSNSGLLEDMHYYIGKYTFSRGETRFARKILKTIPEDSKRYPQSQYLVGLIYMGINRADRPVPKYKKAITAFENARDAIPEKTKNLKLQELRDLATLGLARVYYQKGFLEEDEKARNRLLVMSDIEYKHIPRFSKAWPEAIFERSWTQTVQEEYGNALGTLHNLNAPYFEGAFYPEAEILQGIIYFYNCQWDRIGVTLEATKARYVPVVKHIDGLLSEDLEFLEWYALLNTSLDGDKDNLSEGLIPWKVAKAISEDARFKKMETFLRQLEKEGRVFETDDTFATSSMGSEMADIAAANRDAFLNILGKYVKSKLNGLKVELNDITNRARIVLLETKTAEADWLEQGKEIGGVPRGELPRPFIPSDKFQFWWFRGEYWVDELGYYGAEIKSECF